VCVCVYVCVVCVSNGMCVCVVIDRSVHIRPGLKHA